MTSWKKTKKRRAKKEAERTQNVRAAARYDADIRARDKAEEASWRRQREAIEASRAAAPARVTAPPPTAQDPPTQPSPRPIRSALRPRSLLGLLGIAVLSVSGAMAAAPALPRRPEDWDEHVFAESWEVRPEQVCLRCGSSVYPGITAIGVCKPAR